MNCTNCLRPIYDMRKETRCSICNKPLHKDCAIKEDGQNYCDTCFTVKEEDKTVQKTDIELPEVIRRSGLDTYGSCPYKYYHETIKGIKCPPNIYTQLGVDLHDMFDKASQNQDFTVEQMHEQFQQTFLAYQAELFGDVNRKRMFKRGTNSIDTFYKVLESLPQQPFATEQTIHFSVGDDLPLISCTLDRIDEIDGELEIADWKTGQVMVGQKLSNDIQAPLYICGARDKYQKPIRRFTFYYLEDNKVRMFERINQEEYVCQVNKRKYLINITETKKHAQRTLNQIKKGQFNIPIRAKNMFFTCKMCHIKQMEICKGADIESWRQYNKIGG